MFDRVVVVGAGFIGCSFLHTCAMKGIAAGLVEVNEEKRNKIAGAVPLFEERDFDWSQFYERVEFIEDISLVTDDDLVVCCVGAAPHPGGYDHSAVSVVLDNLIRNNINAEIVIRTTLDPASLTTLAAKMSSNELDGWFYPEYLREGSALGDIAVNSNHLCRLSGNGSRLIHLMDSISFGYELADYKAASFNKIVSNVWRATKISFINQVTKSCLEMDIDPHRVNALFLSDKKNISEAYLKVGGPFGGYCLPKETEYLAISEGDLKTGLFRSVLAVNDSIVALMISFFENLEDDETYHFSNLAFKGGTDDERNSPYRQIADALICINGEKFLAHQTGTSLEISGLDIRGSSAAYTLERWYEFL